MSNYDEREALQALTLWRSTYEQQYFDTLFLQMRAIARVVALTILKKKGVTLEADVIETLTVDSALTLAERLIRRPDYAIESSFYTVLHDIVFYHLYNKKKQAQDKESSLPGDYYLREARPVSIEEEDVKFIMKDILAEDWGRRAVLDRVYCTSYKKFILKIAEYVPRRRIYDFSKRLWLFYNYTPRRRIYRRKEYGKK